MTTPLAVLDLVPISSGSTATQALSNSIDLAQRAEALGYVRYWFAEHHLNPGVAGTSPAVLLALAAAETSTIRLGSGAVQMGHRTALATVEEFGLLDARYPGRFDLGLGRSGGKPGEPAPATTPRASQRTPCNGRTPNGLLIPARFDPTPLLKSPRMALHKALLQLPGAQSQNYTEQVADILALIADTYSADGQEARVVPGGGADLQVWILGSSGGESAAVAGRRGLRFAANYHVAPATVLEATHGYRAAFRPSAELDRPYVAVSADVVVAEDEGTARDLAAGYGPWVRSIRAAEGAIPFPTRDEARAHCWTDADRELVADRVETQFVGTAVQVADQLERLRDATEADELIVTTITHDHQDRVRSYQLLAEEWARR
jgi:alkanesulfonate monooxygenase SsuD/methylene tetrahydromethanopterin reductase-like flavin-dependent oxidoreductase (luciferase family)